MTRQRSPLTVAAAAAASAVAAVAARDLLQREHALLRNFPVVGHARYPARGDRAGAAAVHRRRQRRGAALHPGPAAMGVRVGEDGEQLLRVRHRQRHRVHRRLPVIKHRTFGRAIPPSTPARRARGRRCRARRCSAAPARRRGAFRPELGREHLGDELRLAVRQRDRGAQPGRRAGRLPAQHRRGRRLAVPPQRRRADLPDRHRVLRLPGRARPVRPATG